MRKSALLSLLGLPALASCSFLLDFDALQQGSGGKAGSGSAATGGSGAAAGMGGGGSPAAGSSGNGAGESGEGGMSGKAGSATGGNAGSGTVDCPDECFHDDPCLRGGCDSDGSCLTGSVLGLAHDGFDATIPADVHFRTTMIGGDDAFFLSSFAQNGDEPEVTFYRLDGAQDDFTTIGTLGGLDIGNVAAPASAAGLAVQPLSGVVHAFVAIKNSDLVGARVFHVLLNADDPPPPMPVGSREQGYWEVNPYNSPVALQIGTRTYASWINADQTVAITNGDLSPTMLDPPSVLSAGTTATTLSLLSSTDDQPYVLYTAAGGGVFVERPELAPLELSECQAAPGNYLSSSATFTNLPGFSLSSWTKFAPASGSEEGYLTTTGRAIFCGPDGCAADAAACPASSSNNLVRNPSAVIVKRPGDPPGRREVVQALPAIGVDEEGATAWLVLIQQTLDFDPERPLENGATLAEIAPALTLAEQPALEGNGFRGPDLPAVAFVPPDRFAVAWTQPAASTGDELRIQRFKMCLPD